MTDSSLIIFLTVRSAAGVRSWARELYESNRVLRKQDDEMQITSSKTCNIG